MKVNKSGFLTFFIVSTLFISASAGVSVFDNDSLTDSAVYADEVNATFQGNNLSLSDYGDSVYFMNDSSGSKVAEFNASNNWEINTSDILAGRYNISNGSSQVQVDVFSKASNVTGRIDTFYSSSSPELELRYWVNGSKVENADIAELSSFSSVSSDIVYGLNTSGLEKYWIGVNTSNEVGFTPVSSGTAPHVKDIVIEEGANVSGKIVDESGSAVEDVEVRIAAFDANSSRRYERLPYFEKPPILTQYTDANGSFSFKGLSTAKYTLKITNDSYAVSERSISGEVVVYANETGEEKDLGNVSATMHTGTINGTIDAPTGESIRYAAGLSSENYEAIHPVQSGDYSLKGVPNGSYTFYMYKIDVSRDRFPLVGVASRMNLTVVNGTTVTEDFEFAKKIEFTGYVKNSSGTGLGGASVTASSDSSYGYSTTNASGYYSMSLQNGTEYEFSVSPPFGSDAVGNRTTVNVSTTEDSLNFTLSEGVVLNGTVENESGPVSGGYINVRNYSAGAFAGANINDSGHYRVEGLRKGLNYSVEVEAENGASNRTKIGITGDTEENFTVELKTANLTGYVKNGTGGVAQADLMLENLYTGGEKTATTDANGSYSFTDLREGNTYRLKVDPQGSDYGNETIYEYLGANEQRNITVREEVSLEGTVQDSEGNGLEGVSVYATNYSLNSYGWAITDGSGHYSIDSLKKGEHEVSFRKTGYLENETTLNVNESGKTAETVSLSEGETVSGFIKTNGEETDLDGSISFYNHTDRSYSYSRISNGEYRVDGLENTTYRVWISLDKEKYSNREATVDVSSTDVRNFSVSAYEGKELTVAVEDENGDAIENARVVAGSMEKETGSNGKARFPGQPLGELRIKVEADGYRGEAREINVTRPGTFEDTVKETFRLEAIDEKKIEVNVTKSGDPVEDAAVLFTSNETGVSKSSSGQTDSSGSTLLEHLSTGSYTVSLGITESEVYSNTTNVKEEGSGTLSLGEYTLDYEVNPQ